MHESQGELFARAVRDTLDSIVSRAVRETLLAEALKAAAYDDIPADPVLFLDFVLGPLQKTLERALGVGLGRAVIAEVQRLTQSLSSAPRDPRTRTTKRLRAARPAIPPSQESPPQASSVESRVSRHDAITGPPPAVESILPPPPAPRANAPTLPARATRGPTSRDYPAGTASTFGILSSSPPASSRGGTRRLPLVFVATRDIELVGRFGAWLDPRAAVVRVSRLLDLLLDLQDAGDRRAVIVIDAHVSPIRPEALAALCDELPENVRVMWWGGSHEYAERLSELFPRVAEWLICPDDSTLADVAERCAEIVG